MLLASLSDVVSRWVAEVLDPAGTRAGARDKAADRRLMRRVSDID
jgi:hypothetical protein